MGVKVKRHAPDYYVTDGDNELPIQFAALDGTEVVKYTTDGKRAVIGYLCQDEDAESPRQWDNLGKMVCWHRRYNLGDEQRTEGAEVFFRQLASDYTGRDTDEMEMDAIWKIIHRHYVILPLFLYDHSGITMSTSSSTFRACDSAGWDWGQVGWIYVDYPTIRKEYGVKLVTKKVREKVESVLRSEVETYDQYLTGDVYGVCVDCAINVSDDPESPEWEQLEEHGVVGYNGNGSEIKGNEWEDSCWGYFGHEYAKKERDERIAHFLERLEKRKDLPVDPDQMDLEGVTP